MPAVAFGETLALFRPELEELARAAPPTTIGQARSDVHAREPPTLIARTVESDWLMDRHIGWTTIDASRRFADLVHPDTVQTLRPALAPFLTSKQIADLDMVALFSADRSITQHIASYLHRLHDADGQPLVAGIRYPSRLHLAWECWALFADRLQHGPVHTGAVRPDDPGLLEACRVLDLTIAVAG